jgi:hypothetical protein
MNRTAITAALVVLITAIASYVGMLAYREYEDMQKLAASNNRSMQRLEQQPLGIPETLPYGAKSSNPDEAKMIVDNLVSDGLATKMSKLGGDITNVWVTPKFRNLPREERIKIARAINFIKGGTVYFFEVLDTRGDAHIGKLYDVSKRLEWFGE